MRRGSSRYRSPSEPSAASDRFLAVDRPTRRTAQRSSRSRSHLRNEGLASLGWLREEAEAASVEIALEARGAVQRIGERDVAVGPYEVARVAGKPRACRALAPGEDVQPQSARRASYSQAARRRAMDVHLPVERPEGREVVGLGFDPRQPISAADATGVPLAQEAPAIFDRRLRDSAEHETPDRRQPEGRRDHARRQIDAYSGRQPPAPGDVLKDAVGGSDQAPREADPLRLVAVEDVRRRPPAQRRRQFPGEVDGVADAGVHPLAADGAVDVRSVAEEKGAALSEARRDAMVHVVRREPVHAPDIDAQPLQEALAHLVPTELLAFLLRLGANGADQPGAAFSLEREDGGKVALVDGDVQLAVHERPAGLDVSDVEKV